MAQLQLVNPGSGEPLPTRTKKILDWLNWQIRQISDGDYRVILRKLRKALGVGLSLPAALVLLLIVRALRPVVLIRFGRLRSDRIGHFAANTEIYLCEKELTSGGRPKWDIIYHTPPVCNEQLLKMWRRALWVCPAAIASVIGVADKLNRRLPGGGNHVAPILENRGRDINGLLARTKPHLAFTAEEMRHGREALTRLGIPDGAPFVCFHARDSAYLDKAHPQVDWRYHDYRNSDIRNYIPAAEQLVGRGYFTVRLGSVVQEALGAAEPNIIDYPVSGIRSDFLDIYLGANCRFFFGGDAGIYAVPAVFRRPIVFVNFPALEPLHTWGWNYLTTPKKFWLRRESRFLTFREILDSGIGKLLHTGQYDEVGIEVVENTPEEIAAVVMEMDDRLNGTWQTTEEDEELQRRFWSLFEGSKYHGEISSRVGAEFLRCNRDLLD